VAVNPLKSGDHHDVSRLQQLPDRLRIDVFDAGVLEGCIGPNRDLEPQERTRLAALGLNGDRQQRRGHLLPGGDHGVILPQVGQIGDGPG
jgi:hypothetical protein